jgi:hypothetical protein
VATRTANAPLWKGWSVVLQPKRGNAWSHPDWCKHTRKDAIAAFDREFIKPGEYERRRRIGNATCRRIAVTLPEPRP